MKMILRVVFAVLLFPFSNVPAADAGHRSIEYSEINTIFRFVDNAQSPYVKLVSSVVINEEGITYSDLRLWLTRGEETLQHIEVDPDGSIQLPVFDENAARDILLHINQDEGVVGLSANIGVIPPKQKEVAYKDLFVVLTDTNDFMKEMAGMASWLMPDMDRLAFHFDEAASIDILASRKRYRFDTDDDNVIKIKVKTRLIEENPNVIFSVLPTSVSPED